VWEQQYSDGKQRILQKIGCKSKETLKEDSKFLEWKRYDDWHYQVHKSMLRPMRKSSNGHIWTSTFEPQMVNSGTDRHERQNSQCNQIFSSSNDQLAMTPHWLHQLPANSGCRKMVCNSLSENLWKHSLPAIAADLDQCSLIICCKSLLVSSPFSRSLDFSSLSLSQVHDYTAASSTPTSQAPTWIRPKTLL